VRVCARAAHITSPETIRVKTHNDVLLFLLAACGCKGFEGVTPVQDGRPLEPTQRNDLLPNLTGSPTPARRCPW